MTAEKRYFSTTRDYNRFPHPHLAYRLLRRLVRLVFPRHQVQFELEVDRDEPAVYVVNHGDAYGPVAMVTQFPLPFRPWVESRVCFSRTFPAFAMMDFWHLEKAGKIRRGFWWAVSYVLVPLARVLFCGTEAIPAYFNEKVMITIRKSVETLCEGKNLVIFPERRTPYSEQNEDFQAGFPFLARRYYQKTGKRVKFYPVFAGRDKRLIRVGAPISFDPEADFREHQEAVRLYLRGEMTHLARGMGARPRHPQVEPPDVRPEEETLIARQREEGLLT